MKLQMPWSGWFNNQAKKRKKVEPWVMADVTYEEEFHIELVLRNVINYIDPDEVPDLNTKRPVIPDVPAFAVLTCI